MVFVFLCVTYFTKYNTFQVNPHCHKWQEFILFMTNIPLYMKNLSFFIYSSVDGLLNDIA